MQSTPCEKLGWVSYRLKSRLSREISTTSDMQRKTTLIEESKEELNSLLMRMKESEKAGLKLDIKKTKIMASSLITSRQVKGENVEAVTDFLSLV